MNHVDDPTPTISAANLKEALENADLWDERNPNTSLRCLLSDVLHLIDAEGADNFDVLYERAQRQYVAEGGPRC